MYVPQYEGLEVKGILERIRNMPEVMAYFPIEKEIAKLPRQWIINVTYTLVGEDFKTYIEARIEERNEKMREERNLLITMDPQIAQAFRESTHTSL